LGKDVGRYERAVKALAEVAPNEREAVLDKEWVERTQKVVRAETDRLEHELRGYKNNLIKESIRVRLSLPILSPPCVLVLSDIALLTSFADGQRGSWSTLPSDRRPGVSR